MTASRRERICRLRQDNPCLTLRELGSKVGLTRERVRQILEAESQPTKAVKRPEQIVCINCGAAFQPYGHRRCCCSPECHKAQHWVSLTCDWCGRLFPRQQSTVLYYARNKPDRKWFCGRRCLGFYVAKHFGFWAHPPERKTHCKRGHPFDNSNIYYRPDGGRMCRTCNRERQRESYQRGKRAGEEPTLSASAVGSVVESKPCIPQSCKLLNNRTF